jgi:competence protein ComEC
MQMKRLAAVAFSLAVLSAPLAAQRGPAPTKPLEIYVVDTEGGKAALWVSPSGQSLLIDSGNPGDRDLDRIMAAINDAGLKQIDFLISTHYHVDHIGGMTELAKRIPIAHFIDHGPSVEPRQQVQGFDTAYAELYGKAKHTVVKPGDKVPIAGLDWRIVTSAGKGLKTPLPGGGKANPACAGVAMKEPAPTDDNGQSVGSVITFGQFRAIDLGDLLWNNELDLVCPSNPVGTVDIYFVTHHGLDASGAPPLVHGVQPRVAIMQNGTRKGAGAQAVATIRSSPGLEDLWQLHWSYNAGIEQNSAGVFIANVDDAATIANVLTAPPRGGGPGGGAPGGGGPGGRGAGAGAHTPAYWIKVSAKADGTFTVTNSRNGFSKTYAKRQ